MKTELKKANPIVDSLFYLGGTIEKDNIQHTCNNDYNIAFNDVYLFILDKNDNILKAIKYDIDSKWSYKLLKTKIKIASKVSFILFMQDNLFECITNRLINSILK